MKDTRLGVRSAPTIVVICLIITVVTCRIIYAGEVRTVSREGMAAAACEEFLPAKKSVGT